MKKVNIVLMIATTAIVTLSVGCAKKDLILDLGKGDSINLVGNAGSFDCDDPAYANVEKDSTWTMQFADGTTKHLCEQKASNTAPMGPIIISHELGDIRQPILMVGRDEPSNASPNRRPYPTSPDEKLVVNNDNICDKQQIEAERNACRLNEVKETDLALNQRYQQLLSLIKGDAVTRLKKAQNEWIRFRNSNCTFEAEDILTVENDFSASGKQQLVPECVGRMTQARIVEINFYLDALLKNPVLHAIGVYEGPSHFGYGPIEDPSASTINVHVHVKGRPVVLALMNNDAVMWNIIADEGVLIKEVILYSGNESKVIGINKAVKISKKAYLGAAYDEFTAKLVIPKLEEYTGLAVKSFQCNYRAKKFSIGD